MTGDHPNVVAFPTRSKAAPPKVVRPSLPSALGIAAAIHEAMRPDFMTTEAQTQPYIDALKEAADAAETSEEEASRQLSIRLRELACMFIARSRLSDVPKRKRAKRGRA